MIKFILKIYADFVFNTLQLLSYLTAIYNYSILIPLNCNKLGLNKTLAKINILLLEIS